MIKEKTYEKKASTKNGILRLVFVALSLILETFFFWGIFFTRLQNYISIITVANRLVAFGLVVAIYSQYRSPSIKMPWIMLMMAFPIV
nr:cardiolipin synthase [Lachnospiraceae bacterium]